MYVTATNCRLTGAPDSYTCSVISSVTISVTTDVHNKWLHFGQLDRNEAGMNGTECGTPSPVKAQARIEGVGLSRIVIL